MSSASMQGTTRFVSSLLEGGLIFSDGTRQITAYTATDNGSDLTIGNLTVTETAIIGSSTTESTPSLTVYGRASQLLSNDSSTAFGTNALLNLQSTGAANTSVGFNSGYYTSTGDNNTSVGTYSLQGNSTGNNNVAVGTLASAYSSIASNNTCIGSNSGSSITTGSSNTCIGYNANSSFSNSTAIGYNATVTANNQVVLGTSSETVVIPNLISQQLPNECTAFGSNCLTNNAGANNTAFGVNSMALNTTGNQNAAFGDYSLNSNTSGSYNTAIGHFSQEYTTGNANTSLGGSSLTNNTSGSFNTAIGYGSSNINTTGNTNTNIGYNASSGNYSYSSSLGASSTNTASHQIMLGTTSEYVVIPNTVSIGNNYNASNVVNILGGLNVNDVAVAVSANNNINGSTNTIVGSSSNILQATTNYLNSAQTNIEGNCNIGTGSSTAVCNIEANSIIGASSTNTSTFNAIPNFINGFKCASGNSFKLYCGTAYYVDGSIDCFSANGISVAPQLNAGGTGVATYSLDQTISSPLLGCLVNCCNYYFVFWYYYQPSGTNTINVAFSNLSTNYQNLPSSINYICFA